MKKETEIHPVADTAKGPYEKGMNPAKEATFAKKRRDLQ